MGCNLELSSRSAQVAASSATTTIRDRPSGEGANAGQGHAELPQVRGRFAHLRNNHRRQSKQTVTLTFGLNGLTLANCGQLSRLVPVFEFTAFCFPMWYISARSDILILTTEYL